MYCTNCGKKVSEGNKYCVHCGTPIKGAKIITRPVAPEPKRPVNVIGVDNRTQTKNRVSGNGFSFFENGIVSGKALVVLFFVVAAIIVIATVTVMSNGMERAARDYVQDYYGHEFISIEDYEVVDEEDLEDVREFLDNYSIKKAISDVKINYYDENGSWDFTYVDCIYKDSTGWHVFDS